MAHRPYWKRGLRCRLDIHDWRRKAPTGRTARDECARCQTMVSLGYHDLRRRQIEVIGQKGQIPFLGIWTDPRGIAGIYLRTPRWRMFAGPIFGRARAARVEPATLDFA